MPAARASCESITNAFLYNECLAKEGPQKRGRVPSAGRGVDPESTVRGRSRRIGAELPPANGVMISRRTGSRVSAVIDPWAGVRGGKVERRKRRR